MARVGVRYETVKHAAIKILSQGDSPSVAKIREVLGTGSNTTIAEHLKIWREEHASKEIHHLPANMPKELISAIEVLWQTAMDQAALQLSAVKHELTEAQEILRLDRVAMEKSESELRSQISELRTELDAKQKLISEKDTNEHALQIELSVLHEKLNQQINEAQSVKEEYEQRLYRVYAEKDAEISTRQRLTSELDQLRQDILTQAEKHQTILEKERALQEDSEKRWVKLIDEARVETKMQRKHFESTIEKLSNQLKKDQFTLSEYQQKQLSLLSTIEQKNDRIAELSYQCKQVQECYQKASSTIAVLQERLKHSGNQLKMTRLNKVRKIIQKSLV